MSHSSTIDGAATRADWIELYVRLQAIDELFNALLEVNFLGRGITRGDLGEFVPAAVRGPSRDDLLNELWPADADIATASYQLAAARAQARAGRLLAALVPDQATVVLALALLAKNAETDVRMACDALAGPTSGNEG